MNRKEIIKFCLTLPNTFENRPFQDDYKNVVMKHSYELTKNRKTK